MIFRLTSAQTFTAISMNNPVYNKHSIMKITRYMYIFRKSVVSLQSAFYSQSEFYWSVICFLHWLVCKCRFNLRGTLTMNFSKTVFCSSWFSRRISNKILVNCILPVVMDWRKAVATILTNSVFFLLTGKPRRHLFDILADEEYKRRFKLRQREIIEENDSELTA